MIREEGIPYGHLGMIETSAKFSLPANKICKGIVFSVVKCPPNILYFNFWERCIRGTHAHHLYQIKKEKRSCKHAYLHSQRTACGRAMSGCISNHFDGL